MLRLYFILFFIATHLYSYSQPSDFISVRKKNGRIIKTFTAGTHILFETKNGTYTNGHIAAIKNDSVFVTIFDIRVVPTNLGITIVDTVARYLDIVNYKDIKRIKVFKRNRFIRGKIDRLLIYGGAGYFTLNILNGLYLKQPLTEEGNLKKLAIAVGAVGAGFLIKKYFYVNRFSRSWHKIVYVKVG